MKGSDIRAGIELDIPMPQGPPVRVQVLNFPHWGTVHREVIWPVVVLATGAHETIAISLDADISDMEVPGDA